MSDDLREIIKKWRYTCQNCWVGAESTNHCLNPDSNLCDLNQFVKELLSRICKERKKWAKDCVPEEKERCHCYDNGNKPSILTDFRLTNICQCCLKPNDRSIDKFNQCRAEMLKKIEEG